MRVFNIGSLNIDHVYRVPHFVKPGETLAPEALEVFPGGKGLNQSLALARAGTEVFHCGMIGADGAFLAELLRESGVHTEFLRTIDIPTGHAVIQVNPDGQNCILLYHGANFGFTPAYIREILDAAEPEDLILLQNEINGLAEILRIAHEKGIAVALNPSPFAEGIREVPGEQVDLWLLNEIEGAALAGLPTGAPPDTILDALSGRYPDAKILLTLGAQGAYLAAEGERYYQPAIPCHAVDTTGAGDTFTGFFLGTYLAGKGNAEALRLAATAASLAVSRPGAASSIPYLAEVERFSGTGA